MDSYYEGITELREASSIEEINELLKDGFQILRIADRTTTDLQTKSIVTSPLYIVGRKTTTNQKATTKEKVSIPVIQWTEKNENFSWAFVTDRESQSLR